MALCDTRVAGCGEHLPAWGLCDDRIPGTDKAVRGERHGVPPRRVDARGSADARSSADACLSWQKVQGREANRRRHRLTKPTTKTLCQTPPPPSLSVACPRNHDASIVRGRGSGQCHACPRLLLMDPDPRHVEGGGRVGDVLEWDPVTRWHRRPHLPDLCWGFPGPRLLPCIAGPKSILKEMPFGHSGPLPPPTPGALLRAGGGVVVYLPTAVRASPLPMPPHPPHTHCPRSSAPPHSPTAVGGGPPWDRGSPALFTLRPQVPRCPGRARPRRRRPTPATSVL